jgi:hypothetical protein
MDPYHENTTRYVGTSTDLSRVSLPFPIRLHSETSNVRHRSRDPSTSLSPLASAGIAILLSHSHITRPDHQTTPRQERIRTRLTLSILLLLNRCTASTWCYYFLQLRRHGQKKVEEQLGHVVWLSAVSQRRLSDPSPFPSLLRSPTLTSRYRASHRERGRKTYLTALAPGGLVTEYAEAAPAA